MGHSDTWYNMDKPWGCYAKWNKPVTKRQILYDSAYEIPRVVKFRKKESILHRLLGAGEGRGMRSCHFIACISPLSTPQARYRIAPSPEGSLGLPFCNHTYLPTSSPTPATHSSSISKMFSLQSIMYGTFPAWPVLKIQVQSLFGELRSHMLCRVGHPLPPPPKKVLYK